MANDKNFVVKNGLTVDTNTLYVDASTDRVGINTTSPLGALHVVDDAYVSGQIFVGDAGTFTNGIITPVLDTSDSSAITVIPAATFASDLTVENNIYSNNIVSAQFFVGDGSLLTGIDTGSGAAYRIVEYPTVTNGSADVTMSTAYPIANIDVYLNGAQLKATDDYTVSGSTLTLGTTLETGDVVTVVGYQAATTATLDNLSDTSVSGQASNTLIKFDGSAYVPTSMVEDSSGNVGIGTNNPAGPIDVVSNVNGVAQRIRARSTDEYGLIEFVENDGSTAHGYIGTPAADTLAFFTNNLNERMRIDGSGNVGIGTSSPVAQLDVKNGTTYSSSGDFIARIQQNTNSPGKNGLSVMNSWANTNSTIFEVAMGWNGTAAGYFPCFTIDGSGQAMFSNGQPQQERMRINSSGKVLIDRTAAYGDGTIGTPVLQASARSGQYAAAAFVADATSFVISIGFVNPNGTVGSISTSSSSTSFNTSSDYRLKENVVDLTSAIDRLKLIPVHRFNFIVDPDTTVDGFLAHEVQPHVPEAVTGEKDAVDENGDIKPQGIDQSKLVPLLTAAIQEQQTQIEALEARLSALEGGA